MKTTSLRNLESLSTLIKFNNNWINSMKYSPIIVLLILFTLFANRSVYACGGSSPAADFSVDNAAPVLGQTVTFTDNSTAGTTFLGGTDAINSWSWNFGTGASPATTTGKGPHAVAYSSTGSKSVSLTVTTNSGNSDNKTKNNFISVSATPVPTAGSNSPVCAGSALSLTASTISGATYSWTGPNEFTSSSQNPTVSSSATTAMAGMYSVTVTLYGYTSSAGTIAVTVNSPPTAPTGISGTTSICSGSTTTLTASGGSEGSGCTYQWGTGTTIGSNLISGATASSYTTAALSSNTTYWVRRVGASPCSNTTGGVTQSITVNALPTVSIGIAANPATICQGSSSTISVTNPGTGYTTDWYTGSCGGSAVSGGTGVNSLSVSPAATITYYARKRNTSTGCVSASCANITVTVTPASAGGTAMAATTEICSGNSTTVTVSGYTGTIQWQQSSNGTSGWANVTGGSGATTATYTTPNLTSTTYYRAVLTSGACSSANSSTASVTVNPVSVGGTATAGSSSLCAGNNTTVTVSGYTGSIQWQQSSNGSTGWANVTGGSGATSTTYTTPNLSATTYYRAVVTSGACSSANSTTASVTVNAASVGGTASAAANALCSGSATTINLSGQTGSSIQWQQSPDGTSNWTDVATGTTSYATGNLSSNSFYRAVVTNGICASSSSTVAGVYVSPDFVWNGTNNDWSNASNWKFSGITDNPNVPPLLCSNVTIPEIASGNYPTIAAPATINSLTISDGGSIMGNSNLTVAGTTTMQKEIADDDNWSWHFLSSPVSDQYLWNQFVPTPPNGSGPASWSWPTNNISWDFYYFNPFITNEYPNVPWVNLRKAASGNNFPYNNGNIDDHDPVTGAEAGFGNAQPKFEKGRGYLVSYNFDAGQGPVYPSTSHSFTGSLNYGNVSVTLIRSGSFYHLVGNPYPSYLDWEDADWTRDGLASSENQASGFDYWVFDDGASGGNYLVGNSTGTYSSGISQKIAPMQGFFVKANSSSGAFSFSESVRSHGTQDWIESAIIRNNLLRLQLTTDQNSFHDELMIDFKEQFSAEEGTEKFYSMYSYAPEIWSVKNGNIYTIDRYKRVTSDLKVNVSLKCGVTGTYTITATNINDFTLSNIVYLEDLKTGNKVNLKESGSYSFTGSPNDNKDRFKLYFAEITGKEELANAKKVIIFSFGKDVYINTGSQNTGKCEVYIYDDLGRLMESGNCQLVTGNYKYTTIAKPGVYIVKVVSESGVTATKVIIH
jgi:hypothetical protein